MQTEVVVEFDWHLQNMRWLNYLCIVENGVVVVVVVVGAVNLYVAVVDIVVVGCFAVVANLVVKLVK